MFLPTQEAGMAQLIRLSTDDPPSMETITALRGMERTSLGDSEVASHYLRRTL